MKKIQTVTGGSATTRIKRNDAMAIAQCRIPEMIRTHVVYPTPRSEIRFS